MERERLTIAEARQILTEHIEAPADVLGDGHRLNDEWLAVEVLLAELDRLTALERRIAQRRQLVEGGPERDGT